MASLRFLERLSQHAPDRYDVTVVGAEPSPAYNRVLLSSLLAGEVTEAECRFRDRSWYLRQGIRLITGHPATGIDLEERVVTVGRVTALPFDRLVLATGSTPIHPPIPGIDRQGVRVFRDLSDVEALKALPAAASAVVIGGGLLGLEAASGLARRGVKVTLLHLMDRLMERQLDGKGAELVKRAMERLGIDVRLRAETAAIEGEATVRAVRLSSGEQIAADLVVVAIGVRPNAGLAAASGLATGRGVLVDDRLETSVPGIYALGECAEHRGQCYGLVEPCYAQGGVLARLLGGDQAMYEGSLLSTSLKVSGVPVVSAGDVADDAPGEAIVLSDSSRGVHRKLVVRNGRLVGALLVGDVAHGPRYLDLIRSGEGVAGLRHSLMFGWPSARPEPDRKAA